MVTHYGLKSVREANTTNPIQPQTVQFSNQMSADTATFKILVDETINIDTAADVISTLESSVTTTVVDKNRQAHELIVDIESSPTFIIQFEDTLRQHDDFTILECVEIRIGRLAA